MNKILWENHSLNPKELIEAVWTQILDWIGRLPELGLVISRGKTKGKEYLVNPEFLKKSQL